MAPSVVCEVKMIGTDASEQAYWQTAAVTIAAPHYVELLRVPTLCQPGQVVTLEYERRQRRYMIVAVRENASARLEAVVEAPSIFPPSLLKDDGTRPSFWAEQPKELPQPMGPIAVASRAAVKHGVRRYTRRAVRAGVMVRESASVHDLCGQMTEIGAGGCYVELWSPLPKGAMVEVRCEDTALAFRASGRVVYSDPMVGMGIAFATPCVVAKVAEAGASPERAATAPAATSESAAPRSSPDGNVRLLAELEAWFADHPYLEKVEFLKIKERTR